MSNYLIRSGQTWSVKIAIPSDVQHIFGKKQFKQSLRTADKTVAIARSAPLIAEFKDAIAKARGNPAQLLDDWGLTIRQEQPGRSVSAQVNAAFGWLDAPQGDGDAIAAILGRKPNRLRILIELNELFQAIQEKLKD